MYIRLRAGDRIPAGPVISSGDDSRSGPIWRTGHEPNDPGDSEASGRCRAGVALLAVMADIPADALATNPSSPDCGAGSPGVWDGTPARRPVNSETVPWGKDNFPVLNERALAHQKVFDEAIAPKYDCQPATPPAIEYDPYSMEVVQWPDRVLFRYEKDDQLRTVWLDGRKPTVHD